jgi:putative flippase GtrA
LAHDENKSDGKHQPLGGLKILENLEHITKYTLGFDIDKTIYKGNNQSVKFLKKFFEKHPGLWEIFKFLVVGGVATVIDFVVMALVEYVWKPAYAEIIGTGLGFLCGLVFNYFLSIIFVFTGKGNNSAKAKTASGATLFIVLSVIGLGIHLLGMYVGYDLCHINEWVVKIVLTLVVLVFNYVTRKKLIFANKEKKA